MIIKRTCRNTKNNSKGFTLIELIIVIVIIGMLAAIIIPRFAQFTQKAEDSKELAIARTIYSTLGTAYAKNPDAVPADITSLHAEGYIEFIPEGNWTYTINPIVVYIDGVQIYP